MPNWKKVITSGSDATLNSLNLSGVVNANTDTDKFLVLDSAGNVDFRTGTQVLSDIGAGSGTGTVDTSGTPVANDFARFTDADTIEGRSYAEVRSDLDLEIGIDVQAYDAQLAAIAGLAVTNGGFIVGNGSTFVLETGATARTSLGLGSLATLSTISNSNWSGTDLTIANGGTGASDATTARSNLGLAIGSNVQAYSTTLQAVATSTYTGDNNIDTVGTITAGTWQGTDVGIAHGGTGTSLSDPNGDRIMFWDESAALGGSVNWLQIGTGLSITGTVLEATATGGSGYEWFDGTTYTSASVDVKVTGSIEAYKSGSTGDDVVMAIDGAQGRLFEVTDQLSGSLFSVNDISGIPIFEVFSDDTVNIGTFNNEAIVVSGDTCTASGSFTGILRAEDGAASSPSITFDNDTNTGFYRGTTDTISITTGGTQRGTINNNGWRVNSGALGVNVAASTTDGRIDAGNDIVAFSSDRRLKENINPIENSLEKLDKLSGFTFNWNETANKLAGFDRNQSMVGVFAQDVESVLPEAVKRAPFDNDGSDGSLSGENYLTVQYEKLVPLLIESIKELKAEIEELKGRL
jgi:hypothetical protein